MLYYKEVYNDADRFDTVDKGIQKIETDPPYH